MGNSFLEVMGLNPTEKCGDVVEMWLGLLDTANMTKRHFNVLNSQADPGELLAGLEASIHMFQGSSRSTSTVNSKRNKSGGTDLTHYETDGVYQILRQCPISRSLTAMTIVNDGELAQLNENLRASREDQDDPIRGSGGGERAGSTADPGSASASAGPSAERTRPTASAGEPGPSTPPQDDEENEISAEKEDVIAAIGLLFKVADDNSRCIKCGQSGHVEYDRKTDGPDTVKNSLNKLRDILMEKKEEKKGCEEEQQKGEEEKKEGKYDTGRAGDNMYTVPLTLTKIGSRAHGKLSHRGVKVGREGPRSNDDHIRRHSGHW